MNETDLVRVHHMLRFSRAALAFAEGMTRETFEHDLKSQLALIKAVETIGEAASQVSREGRSQNSQLPWRAMIGMRHILVHEYFNIDLDVLWNTVQVNLPALVIELGKLLSDENTPMSD